MATFGTSLSHCPSLLLPMKYSDVLFLHLIGYSKGFFSLSKRVPCVLETSIAQWSLYVPHSGHFMYSTVVTICTAQWSLYVPHSSHYMYRKVITICTAQWSLYVPHSGHYMYHTVITVCTAQWSLYVPHSGHYMYRTVATICTTTFNIQQVYVLPTQCIYVFCVDLRTNSDYFPKQH
jgi:hypothetical protein